MEEIIFCIIVGILLGWIDVFSYRTKLWLNRLSIVCLFIMLICLGAKIGCDDGLLGQIDTLGKQALILGTSTVLGTIAMFYVVIKTLGKGFEAEGSKQE